jgi:type II secretory pathway pseudopilin PulG
MFGLDARLAMMIFAIMATVAGYVAWGRISMAKTAALAGEVDAMTQALQSYQTDMGTFYLFTLDKPADDDSSLDDITALWDVKMVKEGFKNRWHGPYVTFESRKHRVYGNWSIFYAQGDRKNYCTTDSDCFIWLSLSNVPTKTWNEVNAYMDEGGGTTKEGKGEDITSGRVQADGPTDPRTLIVKTIERPR